MREFELVIDEAFKHGLSLESKVPFNTQLLFECLGFRCGKGGLEIHKNLTNPLPSTLNLLYNWPFPQFITGEKYNFLIVRDSLVQHEDVVYLISEDHSTVTYIFSVDALHFGIGTLMEVADFGSYAFMTNGVIMIYWNVALNTWSQMIASATIPMMRTVCNFKGQAVGGNVVSSWHGCDETFYVWSKIGSMDFTPDQENEAGFRRDPYGGTIYHVRRLDEFVVGYSSKGIVFLFPVSDPVPTFGFKELSNIGLINQGAMNGDKDRQVYVGEDGIVREITKEGIKELGYQYYINQLAGSDIIVSYDPQKKDFYIGNQDKTFLLSPYGMTEVKQHPSTVWRSNNQSYMLPAAVEDVKYSLCTEPFDMGYRGQKTIFSLETDLFPTLGAGAGSGVDYLNSTNWVQENVYKPFNNEGIVAIIASGNAFRFRIQFDVADEYTKIGYLKVRYKMTDLRGIRGVYAPPIRGQA